MKILVCLKQVPDSTTRVKVAPDGKSVVTDGVTWSISPYDEYAIELALEHKDAAGDTVVGVVTAGGARSKDALRQALAMGCDEASLVTGDAVGSLGALGTAAALRSAVLDLRPDLVLCGKQASDDDQGSVGPALAEALGWPHVSVVTKFAAVDGGLQIWKETEGGHEIWKAPGQVLLTVQKSEKEPRYPSLPGIMKAKKKEIPERPADAPQDAATIEVLSMEPPPARGGGKIFKDGDVRAHATELATLLRDEAKVL
ncbi:MAG TPA: electron transfer flavoprotein subunit beta/FixA family protein [Candidatus Limnocylindria bacterium]|nr:electron transfer flavoprotein subunit beta/FixA family protein [Candidatus Limnocylindria bacterium]